MRFAYVIIGAGLAGAATAWHLRRRGIDDVLILERETVPGAHSSGRNAAILRERMDVPELAPLAEASAGRLRSEELAPFRPTGGLHMNDGVEEVAARVPFASGRAAFQPDDGIVDVAALLSTYLAGAEVRYDTTVLSFEPTNDGIDVRTNRGSLEAGVLVNAAGAWAGEIGDLPLTPTNRHLFVTEPDERIDPDWPYIWDFENGYYLRPESGGLLLCACDETPSTPGEPPPDPDMLIELAAKLRRHQPGLGELSVKTGWVGQRTFAPDRLPVIGFDPRQPRLFHVAALGGHGVTLSWSVGALAAALLLGADRDPTFAPERVLATGRPAS